MRSASANLRNFAQEVKTQIPLFDLISSIGAPQQCNSSLQYNESRLGSLLFHKKTDMLSIMFHPLKEYRVSSH